MEISNVFFMISFSTRIQKNVFLMSPLQFLLIYSFSIHETLISAYYHPTNTCNYLSIFNVLYR